MLRTSYPTDRTIFFSDAVFAIAMTLLILEVKLPTIDEVRSLGMGRILQNRIPNLIGFMVSFFVTALFWKAHLQTCSYIKTVSSRFLWLNIWLLFFVVLMPFTTALYSNYGFMDNRAFGLYCLNIAAIGIFNYLLMMHVINKENVHAELNAFTLKWIKLRALVVPFIFLLCIVLAQLSPVVSRYGFLLIFILQVIGDRVHKNKLIKLQPVANTEE